MVPRDTDSVGAGWLPMKNCGPCESCQELVQALKVERFGRKEGISARGYAGCGEPRYAQNSTARIGAPRMVFVTM